MTFLQPAFSQPATVPSLSRDARGLDNDAFYGLRHFRHRQYGVHWLAPSFGATDELYATVQRKTAKFNIARCISRLSNLDKQRSL
jgi:hypothetical protein